MRCTSYPVNFGRIDKEPNILRGKIQKASLFILLNKELNYDHLIELIILINNEEQEIFLTFSECLNSLITLS